MLQYLVKLVQDNSPDLLSVHEDMVSVGPARHVIIETLDSELNKMTNQLSRVKETAATEGKRTREKSEAPLSIPSLEALPGQNATITGAAESHACNQSEQSDLTEMETFSTRAGEHLERAHARLKAAKNGFRESLQYLGQDPTVTSPEFFGALHHFLTTFDAALIG